MKHKIVVTLEHPPKEGESYGKSETVYEQTLEGLDLLAVIHAVNKMHLQEPFGIGGFIGGTGSAGCEAAFLTNANGEKVVK